MRWLVIVFILFGSDLVKAQNLVPNPDFEVYTTCPSLPDQLSYGAPWFNANIGTPDLFNGCATAPVVDVPVNFGGVQNANSGQGYAGLITYERTVIDSREYIEVQLSSTLTPGQYFVSFCVSLADSANYATDDIGIFFSSTSVNSGTYTALGFIPQVRNPEGNIISNKAEWTCITGSFNASGGEEFIVVGNFNSDISSDNVYVGGGDTLDPNYNLGYYYVDDVCVSTDSLTCTIDTQVPEHTLSKVSISPNPTSDYIEITGPHLPGIDLLSLFTVDGRLILKQEQLLTNDRIYVGHLVPGIYLVQLSSRTGVSIVKLIIH